VARTDVERVSPESRAERGELHPLVVIANKQLRQIQPPASGVESGTADRVAGRQGRIAVPAHRSPQAGYRRSRAAVAVRLLRIRRRYHILPVATDEQRVVFATTEPYLTEWREVLRQTLRKDIERVIASPLDINRYQLEFYGVSRSVRGALRGALEPTSGILNFEQLLELGRRGELSADERPIVQIVDWLLQYAFPARSDIHLEPRREQGQISLSHRRRAAPDLSVPRR